MKTQTNPKPFAAPIARHGGATTLPKAMAEDVAAYMRAGYAELEECRNVMIDAFARDYGLSFRQAEALFGSTANC